MTIKLWPDPVDVEISYSPKPPVEYGPEEEALDRIADAMAALERGTLTSFQAIIAIIDALHDCGFSAEAQAALQSS